MTSPLKTAPPAAARSLWQELFWENPMFDEAVRAGQQFVRGGSTPGRALNVIALGLIGFFYVWLLAVILRFGENVTTEILYFELIGVTILVPLSIYGAVAGERERSTWEALVLTRLTPAQITAGKLIWRMLVLVALMLVLALPIVVSQIARPSQGTAAGGSGARGVPDFDLGLLPLLLWPVDIGEQQAQRDGAWHPHWRAAGYARFISDDYQFVQHRRHLQ